MLRFYAGQGLLYDAEEYLQRAYKEYLAGEKPEEFSAYYIEQQISPTASNERLMYVLTSLYLPIDHNTGQERQIGAAFDRETGEVIDNWELFSCPPEEATEKLLDIAGVTDPVLRKEMTEALRPEYMVFFQSSLQIGFPQGSLPSQETAYLISPDYDGKLAEILHEWAIPTQSE